MPPHQQERHCRQQSQHLVYMMPSTAILMILVWMAAQSVMVHRWRLAHHSRSMSSTMTQEYPGNDALTRTSNAPCSCANPVSDCCQRAIRSSHKMGYILTRDLVRSLHQQENVATTSSIQLTQDKRWALPNTTDYREVLVVRNVYDAIVSGYLYHKSGRECWLDAFGRPLYNGNGSSTTTATNAAGNRIANVATTQRRRYFMNGDWEKYLTRTQTPPRPNGRDLCRYLQEEPVLDGMRVYIDVAFGRWYNGLVRMLDLVDHHEVMPHGRRRTLIVCYEELSDPDATMYSLRRMVEWLYPGGTAPAFDYRMHVTEKEGHATVNDTETRLELEPIVAWLDRHLFHGMVAMLQQRLDCSADFPRVKVY